MILGILCHGKEPRFIHADGVPRETLQFREAAKFEIFEARYRSPVFLVSPEVGMVRFPPQHPPPRAILKTMKAASAIQTNVVHSICDPFSGWPCKARFAKRISPLKRSF